MDDRVGGNVFLTFRLPECAQLGPHIAPLVVYVLMARWHLLHRVDIYVNMRGWVGRVEYLAKWEHKAARGVLGMKECRERPTSQRVHPEVFSEPDLI